MESDTILTLDTITLETPELFEYEILFQLADDLPAVASLSFANKWFRSKLLKRDPRSLIRSLPSLAKSKSKVDSRDFHPLALLLLSASRSGYTQLLLYFLVLFSHRLAYIRERDFIKLVACFIKRKQFDIVRRLDALNVRRINWDSEKTLQAIGEAGDLEFLDFVLKKCFYENLGDVDSDSVASLLKGACLGGHQILVEKIASYPNALNPVDFLSHAATGGNVALIKHLLSNPPLRTSRLPSGGLKGAIEAKSMEIVKLLDPIGTSELDSEDSFWEIAAKVGNLEFIDWAVEEKSIQLFPHRYATILRRGMTESQVAFLETFVKKYPFHKELFDKDEVALLYHGMTESIDLKVGVFYFEVLGLEVPVLPDNENFTSYISQIYTYDKDYRKFWKFLESKGLKWNREEFSDKTASVLGHTSGSLEISVEFLRFFDDLGIELHHKDMNFIVADGNVGALEWFDQRYPCMLGQCDLSKAVLSGKGGNVKFLVERYPALRASIKLDDVETVISHGYIAVLEVLYEIDPALYAKALVDLLGSPRVYDSEVAWWNGWTWLKNKGFLFSSDLYTLIFRQSLFKNILAVEWLAQNGFQPPPKLWETFGSTPRELRGLRMMAHYGFFPPKKIEKA